MADFDEEQAKKEALTTYRTVLKKHEDEQKKVRFVFLSGFVDRRNGVDCCVLLDRKFEPLDGCSSIRAGSCNIRFPCLIFLLDFWFEASSILIHLLTYVGKGTAGRKSKAIEAADQD
mmetsp:Transcript_4601/g.19726  ORF Transcript_4601/g.19726 Transcript_4601/m.19726 type:complete len:117 (+) Transcript_4601:244-594(+)